MRKLIQSLAAAAAATAALSLIPLALAGAASASTKPTESTAVATSNWAGYVATIPAKYGIADQFGWVQATFNVPRVTCNGSTESSLQGKRPAGQLYSAAAFWVGLGGQEKPKSKHSRPPAVISPSLEPHVSELGSGGLAGQGLWGDLWGIRA